LAESPEYRERLVEPRERSEPEQPELELVARRGPESRAPSGPARQGPGPQGPVQARAVARRELEDWEVAPAGHQPGWSERFLRPASTAGRRQRMFFWLSW
jgi:hypothetical protein